LLDKALTAADRFICGDLQLENRMTRNLNYRLPSAAEKKTIMNAAKIMTAQKAKGYIAPFKAIEAVEQGLGYDIEADIEREVGLFSDCAVTDVAKNLIGIFLNTRKAGRLPRIEGIEPDRIRKVAMLGGGVMGSGIVNLLLNGGFETILWDIDDHAIEKGVAAMRKTFEYPIKKGNMSQAHLDTMIQDLVKTTTSLEDVKDVDLVIEAVLEDMKIKQDIWKRLEGLCRPDVIFATNTSALPITEIARVLKSHDRASFLQPCTPHAAFGDHMRREDI